MVQNVKVLFSDWTFDTDTRQLRRGSEEVHVSTKAFDLLKLLIDARPRVLSKSELQEALWPGVFVAEGNLFTLVSEIRGAIEDDARNPRFVRTVHGVGYAFSGEAIAANSETTARAGDTPWVLLWERRRFELADGEHVIGRDVDIAITLDSPTVSRRHACVRVTRDATATIEDLDSKNGTFINDTRVCGKQRIVDGDRIRIGSLLMTFRRVGPTCTTETESSSC